MKYLLFLAVIALCASCTCNRTAQTDAQTSDSIAVEIPATPTFPTKDDFMNLPIPAQFQAYEFGERLWEECQSIFANFLYGEDGPFYYETDLAQLDNIGFTIVDTWDGSVKPSTDGRGWLLLLDKTKPGQILAGYDSFDLSYYPIIINEPGDETFFTQFNDKVTIYTRHLVTESSDSQCFSVFHEFCIDCPDEEPQKEPFNEYEGKLCHDFTTHQWTATGIGISKPISEKDAYKHIQQWEDNIVTEYPFTPISALFKK